MSNGNATRSETITSKQDIETIFKFIKRATDSGNPPAILIGAGASYSAGVPLAKGFVDAINADYSHCLHGAKEDEKSSYQFCMGRLSQADRKRLIEKALDSAKVNWGHIALAQMISNGTFSRVLSFNFDLLVEKSLSLLGLQFAVYDFGSAPSDKLTFIAEPAIIHLHGQGYGIKLINDKGETDEHIEKLAPLFTDTLKSRNLIVIGYSGFSDPYMKLIVDNFSGDHNLIWLNFGANTDTDLAELEHFTQLRVFNNCDFDQMMIGLAELHDTWPPEFVRNPLKHTQTSINAVHDYPRFTTKDVEIDIVSFLRSRLQQEVMRWDESAEVHGIILNAAMNPQDEDTFQNLVRILERDGTSLSPDQKRLTSMAFLKKATSVFPDDFGSRVKIAKDTLEEVMILVTKSLEYDPTNASAHVSFAKVLTSFQGDHDLAETHYLHAISTDPNDAMILVFYADFQSTVRRNHEAADDLYVRALNADPNNPMILGAYARFRSMHQNDHDVTEDFYKRAIKADPNNSTTLGNYAQFLTNYRNDHDAAEDLYRRAVEANPNNSGALTNYANLVTWRRNDHDAAEELYKRAIDADPINVVALCNYAGLLIRTRNDHDAAEDLYKRAIKAEPQDVGTLRCYASFLSEIRGDHASAEGLYKRANDASDS